MRESIIAVNRKTGRLFCLGPNLFEGERLTKGGKWETRRFSEARNQALFDWHQWQKEVEQETFIQVSKTERPTAKRPTAKTKTVPTRKAPAKKESDMATRTTNKREQKFVYLLSFQGQRSTKAVAVFQKMDSAIDMSDALTVALDVTGQEGKYVVDELPIWGE